MPAARFAILPRMMRLIRPSPQRPPVTNIS
jgi:hypothetical protein